MKNLAKLGKIFNMGRSYANIVLSVLLFLSALQTFAAPRVEVTVEPHEVEYGNNIAVIFEIASDKMSPQISQPKFSNDSSDFDEVNSYSRGFSIQSVIQNGSISNQRVDRMVVVLHPKKTGSLTIRQPSVVVDGQTLKASDVTIEVLSQGSQRSGGRTQSQGTYPQQSAQNFKSNASILIRTEPDKTRVYKGEQIILSYVLYVKQHVNVMQLYAERYPTASGFLKEDLDIPMLRNNLEWTRTVINGQEYRRAVLAQYAVFPVKEGKLSLDTFSAKLTFRSLRTPRATNDDDDDAFGLNQFFQAFQTMTDTYQSDHKVVEVLPLPAEGQPPGFTGLVGDFDITAMVDKYTTKAGEPINVKVKIEGKGHAGSAEKISVQWPNDFEQYEDKSVTHYFKTGRSERIFDYLVIPRIKGMYQIPSVGISMFNVDRKSYQTKKTEPIQIQVTEGTPTAVGVARPAIGNKISEKEAVEDIRYLLSDASKGASGVLFLTRLGQVVAVLSVFAFLFSVWGYRNRELSLAQQNSRTYKQLVDKIRKFETEADTVPIAVLAGIDNTLTEFLNWRYGIQRGSMTRPELQEALKVHIHQEDAMCRINALCELCENQRFLPPELAHNPQEAKKAVRELQQLIDVLTEA